jgi:segregation and condensation protein A
MPLQEDYQIALASFRGPLDLLLYLIRRAEVDIHDIPIAQITDQYLVFLKQLEDIDIDVAGEFLVMAATLIEIKSRTIAPLEKSEDGDQSEAASGIGATEAADPRYVLVQQLLAYQKYRIASDELETRRLAFLNRYPRKPADWMREATRQAGSPAPAESDDRSGATVEEAPFEIELEDAHVFDLSESYERIMESIDFGRLGDHRVEIDDTPIALHQEDLLDRLNRSEARRLTLQDAFEGAHSGQRIGLFMATLELVRLRRITVVQPEIDSPIELVLNEDSSEALVIETDEIAHYGEKREDSQPGGGRRG